MWKQFSPFLCLSCFSFPVTLSEKTGGVAGVQLVPISVGYRHQVADPASQVARHHHQTAPDHRPAPAPSCTRKSLGAVMLLAPAQCGGAQMTSSNGAAGGQRPVNQRAAEPNQAEQLRQTDLKLERGEGRRPKTTADTKLVSVLAANDDGARQTMLCVVVLQWQWDFSSYAFCQCVQTHNTFQITPLQVS